MDIAHPGELAALGTAVCWTVTGLSFEAAGRRVGSLSVNLIRLVMAFGLLALFGLATRGQALPLDATTHAWVWLGISGLIGFAFGDLCLFRAYVLVGSRISMLLMSLVPPIAAVIGWFFLHEQLAPRDWLGMGITVTGIVWVVLERSGRQAAEVRSQMTKGVLLAFLGAVGQAVGLVLSKLGMGSYDAFAATQIRIIAGLVGLVVIFFVIGWWPRVWSALAHRGAMTRISLGAFFGPFLGVSLSLVAIQHTQTGVAATIMAIVPVLIIAPAAILFRERITLRAVLGASLAVAGVVLLFR
ncbi:MAG: DMT family transporter [Candidatus Eisenbacteria sp.]|nr:DMT family transporter [Candidatus Eisenbacteria bacterium]